MTTADVSVRVGWADDAAGIAGVQVRAWQQEYADLLPPLDPADVAAAWQAALAAPKDARNRVLVALDRATVRGFAVVQPSPDPDADPVSDGELTELSVDPEHQRQGHGSRLVHAAMDTLRADRFDRALVWLASTDDARRGFLVAAGFEADGAHRELDLHGDGTVTVKQIRLHAGL
ncbi:MAG TPA: GNAT family N-acetyltransferase [Nocardioidaceae bacterium]|nr:GNAT family N-acetyltransferase [Nocardioidaceae bacterium]